MTNKKNIRAGNVLLIVFLTFFVVQAMSFAHAQTLVSSGQWTLNLQVENAQNTASATFAPFDPIQVCANVTFGNATQPDILVTFKLQGPSGSNDEMNITRVAATDAAGSAECLLRLPAVGLDTDSLIGTWQAAAAIQTSNGTLQALQTFTTEWNIQITSIGTQNQQSQNQTIFHAGKTVTVQVGVSNRGAAQPVNVTLDMVDSTGKVINQTQIQNKQIPSSNSATLAADIQVPSNSTTGEATIIAAAYSGTYQDVPIPAADNQTAYFSIASGTAPQATPTPTHPPAENSIALFSWLMVATGFFTFTALYMFLRRKPADADLPKPNLPGAEEGTPPAAQSTLLVLEQAVQEPKPEQAQPSKADSGNAGKLVFDSEQLQAALESRVFSNLNRIAVTASRIQALKDELKSERDILTRDLSELNQAVWEQQRAAKSYFDDVTAEIRKLEALLSDEEEKSGKDQTAQPAKQDKK